MKLLSFLRGGVHPKDMKLSAGSPIESIPNPDEFKFPLLQHIGAPALAVVKPGDKVSRGMLLAKTDVPCSASVHSSVSGVVKSVSHGEIVIKKDETQGLEDAKIDTAKKSLLEVIKEAGIVGLGGATFPTHVKLSPADPNTIDTIIINAAECEPYLTADHRLILEEGPAIIDGIKLIQGIFPKNPKAYIGIEANKMDAYKHLKSLISPSDNIELRLLRTMYPQGGEKQLIQAILKKEVPSGGFPFNIGMVVQNVGTVFAIHEAYRKGKPLYDRVVTVSGDLVKEHKNFKVAMGTPISHLMSLCGVEEDSVEKIVIGGPMMGKTTSDLSTPVTKAVSGVLFFSKEACLEREERDCISCGSCVDKCPVGLVPSRLAVLSQKNKIEDTKDYGVNDCMECGCCAYSCPASIKIVQWIKLAKDIVRAEIRKRSCSK